MKKDNDKNENKGKKAANTKKISKKKTQGQVLRRKEAVLLGTQRGEQRSVPSRNFRTFLLSYARNLRHPKQKL